MIADESLTAPWRQRRRQGHIWALRGALQDSDRPMTGYELARVTGLSSAAAYLTLTFMLNDGTVDDSWGEPGPKGLRRRYYRLTERPAS